MLLIKIINYFYTKQMKNKNGEQKNDLLFLKEKATQANEAILKNKILLITIDMYKTYLKLTKEEVNKCFRKDPDVHSIFNHYYSNLNSEKTKLKKEYNEKLQNYNNLSENGLGDIVMDETLLDKCASDKFVLKYSLIGEKNTIKCLQKSIQSSKQYSLFREPKREELIEVKKASRIISKEGLFSNSNMLFLCKKYNKIRNHCEKKLKKLEELNKKKKELKDAINDLKKLKNNENENITPQNINIEENIDINNIQYIDDDNDNDNIKTNDEKDNVFLGDYNTLIKSNKQKLQASYNPVFYSSLKNLEKEDEKNENSRDKKSYENDNNLVISTFGQNASPIKSNMIKKSVALFSSKSKINATRNKKKRNKNIIQEFPKIEELFDSFIYEDENEHFIQNELHSDDDTNFEPNINAFKCININYKNEIEKKIPKLNFGQINYNTLKNMKEIDINSLQRRKYKAKNIVNCVKEKKEEIKKYEQIIERNKKKINILKNYINNLEKSYNSLKPLKILNTFYDENPIYFKKNIFGNIDEEIEEEEDDKIDGKIDIDYFKDNKEKMKLFSLSKEKINKKKKKVKNKKKIIREHSK